MGQMGPRPVPRKASSGLGLTRAGWPGCRKTVIHQEVACTRGGRGCQRGEGAARSPGESAEARVWTAGKRGGGVRKGPAWLGWRRPAPSPAPGTHHGAGVGSAALMSWLLGSLRLSSRRCSPAPSCASAWPGWADSRSGKGGISSSTVACKGFGQGWASAPVSGWRRGKARAGHMGTGLPNRGVRAGHRAEGEVQAARCRLQRGGMGPAMALALDGGLEGLREG